MAKGKKPSQEALRAEAKERVRNLPVETQAGRLEPDTSLTGEMEPETEPDRHQREQLGDLSQAVREQMARQPQIKRESGDG